jgi:hypothetical protein
VRIGLDEERQPVLEECLARGAVHLDAVVLVQPRRLEVALEPQEAMRFRDVIRGQGLPSSLSLQGAELAVDRVGGPEQEIARFQVGRASPVRFA